METYCVNCKKNISTQNVSVRRTKQNRLILLSNCVICGKKQSNFIKNKEAGEILSQFFIKHYSINE